MIRTVRFAHNRYLAAAPDALSFALPPPLPSGLAAVTPSDRAAYRGDEDTAMHADDNNLDNTHWSSNLHAISRAASPVSHLQLPPLDARATSPVSHLQLPPLDASNLQTKPGTSNLNAPSTSYHDAWIDQDDDNLMNNVYDAPKEQLDGFELNFRFNELMTAIEWGIRLNWQNQLPSVNIRNHCHVLISCVSDFGHRFARVTANGKCHDQMRFGIKLRR